MVRVVLGGVVVAFVVSLVAAGSGTPVLAQAKPQKLDFAYILAPPESGAVAFKWMAEEVTRRSHATLTVVFHGGTLLNKELEIMDAVKSGTSRSAAPRARRPPSSPSWACSSCRTSSATTRP